MSLYEGLVFRQIDEILRGPKAEERMEYELFSRLEKSCKIEDNIL